MNSEFIIAEENRRKREGHTLLKRSAIVKVNHSAMKRMGTTNNKVMADVWRNKQDGKLFLGNVYQNGKFLGDGFHNSVISFE